MESVDPIESSPQLTHPGPDRWNWARRHPTDLARPDEGVPEPVRHHAAWATTVERLRPLPTVRGEDLLEVGDQAPNGGDGGHDPTQLVLHMAGTAGP